MCRRRLGKLAIGLRLGSVYEVWKFDRILYEKDRHVVADEIEIAFLRVKLDGESAHIPCEVARPLAAGNGRKSYENWSFFTFTLQKVRFRHLPQRLGTFEIAVRC
jgi:hypothetical protein